ncbi:FadR/GntR family transcriptional regulator [Salibacterium halotolerans]|uniref:DNA-binding transcriptional regulator, FadR family n=1 Tax=Salibacterium halotolerans TaxID=1884432 RepID=A0A1I5SXQ4_9BACI|nr:FadR/GntR family transcriptional regulator [Salibacterium halotolerans]SFP75519.1 DNA-binding transcriptional regulator, FadR family [Salibacterium halotolerans]
MNENNHLIDQPLTKKTLSKQVEEKIVDLLLQNKMQPGDKLPSEMELIDMLGVSRSVLREALSSLESLGIIRRQTKGGTYFAEKIGLHPFSVMLSLVNNNLEAIIEARMTLELGLVALAAEKITAEELQRLHDTIEAIKQTEDNDYGEHDITFHQIIASSVENPVIQGMIDSLLLTHTKMNIQIPNREKEKTVAYHEAIYEALKERNPQKATQEMYAHLVFARDKVLNQ